MLKEIRRKLLTLRTKPGSSPKPSSDLSPEEVWFNKAMRRGMMKEGKLLCGWQVESRSITSKVNHLLLFCGKNRMSMKLWLLKVQFFLLILFKESMRSSSCQEEQVYRSERPEKCDFGSKKAALLLAVREARRPSWSWGRWHARQVLKEQSREMLSQGHPLVCSMYHQSLVRFARLSSPLGVKWEISSQPSLTPFLLTLVEARLSSVLPVIHHKSPS